MPADLIDDDSLALLLGVTLEQLAELPAFLVAFAREFLAA